MGFLGQRPFRSFMAARSGLAAVFLAAPVCAVLTGIASGAVGGQVPVEAEVRQIVTFSFVPGKSADAIDVFRQHALPLYEADAAMLSFRAFREVESSIPLDLVMVSAFRGMAGMDISNAYLSGAGIGSFYGQIGGLISGHTDQFVEMLPSLGSGDASSRSRTAFVWYRTAPGQANAFEEALEMTVVAWEEAAGIPSTTGRFLVSDGWHYLRFLGFDSLGDYQEYWTRIRTLPGKVRLAELTVRRQEVIVASVAELAVR